MTKYVYKEVSGDALEKMTESGWEYVERGAGQLGCAYYYVIRRPFKMPKVMKLSEELAKTKDELQTSISNREYLSKCLDIEKKLLDECQGKVDRLEKKVDELQARQKRTMKGKATTRAK